MAARIDLSKTWAGPSWRWQSAGPARLCPDPWRANITGTVGSDFRYRHPAVPDDTPLTRLEMCRVEIDRVYGRGFSRDHPNLFTVLRAASLDAHALTLNTRSSASLKKALNAARGP